MAEAKIKSRDWLLYVSDLGANDYKVAACLTSNSLTQEVDAVDTSSKCGSETQVGDNVTASIDFEGFEITQDTPFAKESFQSFFARFQSKEEFDWRLRKVGYSTNDYRIEGNGFLSSLTQDSADGEYNTFSGTITCKNPEDITLTPEY